MKQANTDLMRMGWVNLKANWGLTVGLIVLYSLCNYVISIIPILGVFISIFVAGAFNFGISRYFLNIVENTDRSLNDMFTGFSFLGKTFFAYCIRHCYWLFLALLLFFFVGFNITMLSDKDYLQNLFLSINPMVLFLVFVVFVAIGLFFEIMFSQTFFILADSPEITALGAIQKSMKYMSGYKLKFFLLMLLFILLGLVLCLIFLIFNIISPIIFIALVIPFVFIMFTWGYMTLAVFYNELKNLHEDKVVGDDFITDHFGQNSEI